MTKVSTVQAELKQAMLDKNTKKVLVLRSLLTALKNKQIEKGAELTEEEVGGVLQKEAKKREESIVMYKQAGREELVSQETEELQLIKEYLPTMLSKDEVEIKLKEMKQAGTLGDDFGAAMKTAMQAFKGKADGKLVAEAVRALI